MPSTPRLGSISQAPLHRCVHCRISQTKSRCYALTGQRRNASSHSSHPRTGATLLTNRHLLAIHGQDAAPFLHGITTNTVGSSQATAKSGIRRRQVQNGTEATDPATMQPDAIPATAADTSGSAATDALTFHHPGLYSAFLSSQGRVLHDVFLYPASHSAAYRARLPRRITEKHAESDPAFLIEVDARDVQSLQKYLSRYKLRSKLDLWAVDPSEWGVWAAWGLEGAGGAETSAAVEEADIGCKDTRAPGLGWRLAQPLPSASGLPDPLQRLSPPLHPLDVYTARRRAHGVPEGQATGEIEANHALPHEANLDLMGAIDFRKGCYVGQELTIRTQHTGVVRKRILPVTLYGFDGPASQQGSDLVDKIPPAGADFVPRRGRGRPAGRWLAGSGSEGLALCRVELMTDLDVTGDVDGGRRHDGGDLMLRARKAAEGNEEERQEGAIAAADLSGIGVRATVPDWVRKGVKVRAPQVRV